MDTKDLIELADNPNFISGIYNYCDRWCERCPFTARCLSFAIQQEEGKAGARQRADNRGFWKKLEDSLRLTQEWLDEVAKEQGVSSAPAELKKISRQEE